MLKFISCWVREEKVLREILEDVDLSEEVRLLLEEALSGYPNQDIHILSVTRSREDSEKGREELNRARQELL